jgi:hypothetical protein
MGGIDALLIYNSVLNVGPIWQLVYFVASHGGGPSMRAQSHCVFQSLEPKSTGARVECDKGNDYHCLFASLYDTLLYMSKASIPPILAIRLPPKERAGLERAARADDRPVSTLARKIIVEWLHVQEAADASK